MNITDCCVGPRDDHRAAPVGNCRTMCAEGIQRSETIAAGARFIPWARRVRRAPSDSAPGHGVGASMQNRANHLHDPAESPDLAWKAGEAHDSPPPAGIP